MPQRLEPVSEAIGLPVARTRQDIPGQPGWPGGPTCFPTELRKG